MSFAIKMKYYPGYSRIFHQATVQGLELFSTGNVETHNKCHLFAYKQDLLDLEDKQNRFLFDNRDSFKLTDFQSRTSEIVLCEMIKSFTISSEVLRIRVEDADSSKGKGMDYGHFDWFNVTADFLSSRFKKREDIDEINRLKHLARESNVRFRIKNRVAVSTTTTTTTTTSAATTTTTTTSNPMEDSQEEEYEEGGVRPTKRGRFPKEE
jgi:hypothetical protein